MSDDVTTAATIASLRSEVDRLTNERADEREEYVTVCREIDAMTALHDRERITRKEAESRAESLSSSIMAACTGSGCLNAHELRQTLDTARAWIGGQDVRSDFPNATAMRAALNRERERAGVLEAEVRAWHVADGYLDLVDDVRVFGKEIDYTTLQLAMAIVDRTHALDAAKFGGA